MKISEKYLKVVYEFFRYVMVGGISFIVDFAILYIFKEYIFASNSKLALFFSTAMGFISGLLVNYILSIVFVFRKDENKSNGRSIKAFIVFAFVGIIGLLITEIGMYTAVHIIGIHYMISKVGNAGVVLVWNYCGRKIFVFDKMG